MVVVVIIGILAAVAVPKLFGMIAKSKASEVGPAAGTYVKMQQAYISEAVKVGDWKIIGYVGPGEKGSTDLESSTTNFEYKDGGTYSEHVASLTATDITGFSVKNKTKLNDCVSTDGNWTVKVKKASGSGAAEGDAVFTAATNCTELTPNFDKIGK
ncbi:type II secretion system protein, partial [uncultured Fibrobacter sp.]|uniref:type IV pilin protein n=1 Tax=uncultured Fibrobacter sp. TaxID=261512 RepID=UPI002804E67B